MTLEKPDFSEISKDSGIYIFKNNDEEILYIGKAKNLKNRVSSYWKDTSWRERPKLAVLVPKVAQIDAAIKAQKVKP